MSATWLLLITEVPPSLFPEVDNWLTEVDYLIPGAEKTFAFHVWCLLHLYWREFPLPLSVWINEKVRPKSVELVHAPTGIMGQEDNTLERSNLYHTINELIILLFLFNYQENQRRAQCQKLYRFDHDCTILPLTSN